MITVVESAVGHYEVEETRYSKSYVWHPGHITVECECGERLCLTPADRAVCGCGRNLGGVVAERLEEIRTRCEDVPWRGEMCNVPERSERRYWDELNELD